MEVETPLLLNSLLHCTVPSYLFVSHVSCLLDCTEEICFDGVEVFHTPDEEGRVRGGFVQKIVFCGLCYFVVCGRAARPHRTTPLDNFIILIYCSEKGTAFCSSQETKSSIWN